MRIHKITRHKTSMNTGSASVSSLKVGNLTTESISIGDEIPTTTVIGFSHVAPTSISVTSSLNKSPGLPKATSSSDPNLLSIPDGANIIAIRYRGLDLVGPSGGSAFDLGMNTFDGSISSSITLIDGGTETIANTGAGGIHFSANSSGATGAPGLQVPSGSNFVILGMRNTPITSGTLVVEIDYVL